MQRTFELGSDEALGMMKVFIAEPDASPQLRAQIEAVLATHRTGADLVDKISTLREQLSEYRSRSGELNAQLVSLEEGTTLDGVVRALNALGASPRDIIAIMQALKVAGALKAELVVL